MVIAKRVKYIPELKRVVHPVKLTFVISKPSTRCRQGNVRIAMLIPELLLMVCIVKLTIVLINRLCFLTVFVSHVRKTLELNLMTMVGTEFVELMFALLPK